MTTQATRVIDKFGGMRALARILGHRNPTTIQGWRDRGFIPSRRHEELLQKAREHGVDLTKDDFFASAG